MNRIKWTFEKCYKEAKSYKTYKEFRGKSKRAFYAAVKNNWIVKFDWLEKAKHTNGYWNKERCFEEAKKYNSKSSFQKGSTTAYQAARRNKWLNNYSWFKTPTKKRKWTYWTCYREAKKYTAKGEFAKNSSGAYNAARKNDWIKKYIWLKGMFPIPEWYFQSNNK